MSLVSVLFVKYMLLSNMKLLQGEATTFGLRTATNATAFRELLDCPSVLEMMVPG